jgi:hypothetical protein
MADGANVLDGILYEGGSELRELFDPSDGDIDGLAPDDADLVGRVAQRG